MASSLDTGRCGVVTLLTMPMNPRTRRQGRTGPVAGGPGTKAILIKGVTPELHKQFRVACAEEGMAAHQLLDLLLEERASRQRRRAAQVRQSGSPFHSHMVPQNIDGDDSAVSM